MENTKFDTNYRYKKLLLKNLGNTIYSTALNSQRFHGGDPLETWRYEDIAGPRAGIIKLSTKLNGGRLVNLLTKNDLANLRGIFDTIEGWELETDPKVYFKGSRLTIEADWPSDLQLKNVSLGEINLRPQNGRSALLGLRQDWEFKLLEFNRKIEAHSLIVGKTGSGKTVTALNILCQLARGNAQFVIMDGRGGPESLEERIGEGVKNMMGPIALYKKDAVAALGYAWKRLQRRKHGEEKCDIPLHIIVDEFQEFTQVPLFSVMASQIGRQGRAVNIHLHFITQRPDADLWGKAGKSLQSQFGVDILHLLDSWRDVMTVTGESDPPAHLLSDCGDAYVITASNGIERVQIAMPTQYDLQRVSGKPLKDKWQPFTAEDFNSDDSWENMQADFSLEEKMSALKCAILYEQKNGALGGRGTLQKFLQALGKSENNTDKLRELLDIGKKWNSTFNKILGE